jgi:hypothetical protein
MPEVVARSLPRAYVDANARVARLDGCMTNQARAMELILVHRRQVAAPDGTPYTVSVWGEARQRLWVGWIEFQRTGGGESLRTGTETTQSTRTAVRHWAEFLNPLYLEGAFERASRGKRPLVAHAVPIPQTTVSTEEGLTYDVRVHAREEAAGTWLGDIEFVPSAGGPSLRAERETSQPSLALVEYWAGGLQPVFLEGALDRARRARARRG